MPTDKEIVEHATKLNAAAESGLKTAMDCMIEQSGLYVDAYQNGSLKGGEALKMRNRAITLAGDIAALHSELIEFHEAGTELAKGAGINPSRPFAELPVTTRGGGR